MAYALSNRLFIENGPAIHAAGVRARSSASAFRAWRALDAEHRLALVDQALRIPANEDLVDGYPAAL